VSRLCEAVSDRITKSAVVAMQVQLIGYPSTAGRYVSPSCMCCSTGRMWMLLN